MVSTFQDRRPAASLDCSKSILDVGCGNGRFREYARNRLQGEIRYVGVDASLPLLAEAGERDLGSTSFRSALAAAELVANQGLRCLGSSTFDLVVAFGLLHHIPAKQGRLNLLTDLASRLKPTGMLAVSFWQFGEHDRFLRRSIPWDDYNRQAEEPIDTSELEEGDMILAWGEVSTGETTNLDPAVRFCHFTNEAEADELINSLPLELVEDFGSDGDGGRQNLYYLMEKPCEHRRG